MVVRSILSEYKCASICGLRVGFHIKKKKSVGALCAEIQCVNKLLKPSRVLLSMHKPFELVFLICLG